MINLLVTGACGFIGSNFVNSIFDKNYRIINIDAMYYCADEMNIKEHIRNNENYILVKGNLTNISMITETLTKYNVTKVIHFAAQSHVQNSFEDSLKFTYDNVFGTHTLLEACRKYGKIEKFIHVSTDEVYGESMLKISEVLKTENSILCPSNPYAATKAGAELIAQSYYYSWKMPIIVTRGNNVYGINQYPEKLIPKFIMSLNNDEKLTIQGTGENVRAFLHVNDAVSAFKIILEKGIIGEIYNIGCDENMEYSVLTVANMLISLHKKYNPNIDKNYIEFVEDRPFNDKRYYISNQKLKDLGWTINIDFEQGLEELYKINLNAKQMQAQKQVQKQKQKQSFIICTNKYGIYIGNSLQEMIIELGFDCKIIYDDISDELLSNNKFLPNEYFIIFFVHLHKKMPEKNKYIIYQLEQKEQSNFINKEVLLKIQNSLCTFDYSHSNIQSFDRKKYNNILFQPMPIKVNYGNGHNEIKIYDLLFYGSLSGRRRKILSFLKDRYNIFITNSLFGSDIEKIINRSKIIINIHNVKNGLLETARINEIIMFNKLIISEKTIKTDCVNENFYKDKIVYCPVIENNLKNIAELTKLIDHYLIQNNYDNFMKNNECVKKTIYENSINILDKNLEHLFF